MRSVKFFTLDDSYDPDYKLEVITSSEIIPQRCPLIKEGKEGIATILGGKKK